MVAVCNCVHYICICVSLVYLLHQIFYLHGKYTNGWNITHGFNKKALDSQKDYSERALGQRERSGVYLGSPEGVAGAHAANSVPVGAGEESERLWLTVLAAVVPQVHARRYQSVAETHGGRLEHVCDLRVHRVIIACNQKNADTYVPYEQPDRRPTHT